MNKIIILGNLTQDPELKYTASGKAVCNLRIANNTEKKTPLYIDVVCWEKLAESCSEYLAKGRQVLIEGSLRINTWTDGKGQDRATPEISAYGVTFLGSKESNGNRQEPKIERPEALGGEGEFLPESEEVPF